MSQTYDSDLGDTALSKNVPNLGDTPRSKNGSKNSGREFTHDFR